MIGKRDPVATLATLVLLSYTRLLRTTITSLAFAPLTYPNGTRKVLWFPQPSIGFDTLHNRLKIGSLLLLATVIIVATVLYTFILTFWQCLIRCPRSNLFKWVRNQKIHIFFETYHTPYTQKHRYWTGILLLVRIIVHLVAATTAAVDQFIALLVTVALMCGLQFYKMVTVIRLYKNILIDVMESATFFNIAIFALVTLYTQLIVPGNRNSKGVVYFQVVVAYVSVGVTLALLVGVLTYHAYVHCSAKMLFKGSDLRAKLTSPAFVRSSRELKQDNVETSENAFLDALDRPRAAYRTPFVHFPTTSVLSPPLRKLSHNWNLTQKESRNLSDSEIAALVTLQKKKASQDRQGQLKNENESELNFDFEGVHDQ